jgi:hypothetical protein
VSRSGRSHHFGVRELDCVGEKVGERLPNATLRYATLRHATPRYATLRHATPRYATLRHATPRYATLRHATPRYATLVADVGHRMRVSGVNCEPDTLFRCERLDQSDCCVDGRARWYVAMAGGLDARTGAESGCTSAGSSTVFPPIVVQKWPV